MKVLRQPTKIELRQRRSTRLYRAALELFRAHGYEATTISMITAEAGVSRRTFFNYYPSKEHVLAELHRELTEGALTRLELPGCTASTSALAAIRSALMHFGEALEGEHGLAVAMLRLVFSSATLREQDDADAERFVPALIERIEQAQQAGELRAEHEAAELAPHLMAVVTGALTHWALAGPGAPGSLCALLDTRLELAFMGVLPDRSPDRGPEQRPDQ